MALCTAINPMLNENSTQPYPHSSAHDIDNMYSLNLRKILNTDIIKHLQLTENLARRLDIEGIILMPKNTKTHMRSNNRFITQSQTALHDEHSNQIINNDTYYLPVFNTRSNLTIVIPEDYDRYYSTKTPYRHPPREHTLSLPPAGFKPICVQVLARHGSRTLNSRDYDIQILKIWQLAKQKKMLTSLGEQLKDDIEQFMHANNHIGRGELTQLGKDEHINIGVRLYNRLKPLFTSSNKVTVMSSGKKRAIDSAQEFLNGLTKSEMNIQIHHEKLNKKLLYFHKSCTNYATFKKSDPHVKTALNSIKVSSKTKAYAKQILQRLYANEFVEYLIKESYECESHENIDVNGRKPTKNEVDIVMCLYDMFSVAPAQNQLKLTKMLAKYFTKEESEWFSYVNDAQEFYVKGPSIDGITVTSDMAKPLLADFFSSVNTCTESNTKVVANLRFSHAETIIPFTTLLRIPGFSDQSAHPSDIYTYENNQWRGDKVAPMAANIQWEIYRHEYDHKQILVRMLYNELEVRFKQDCKSISPESFFYDFNELKRSYSSLLFSSQSDVN